jgi:ubiquinone/menaquinone biosynthesis C-methylase UbiE
VVVDVGCGTGRYAYALAERVAARVIGIDPSAKMLAGARANLAETALSSAGEQLTLADGCADMVFLSMILHHLKECPRQAEECRRVLRRGGRICVRNSTHDLTYGRVAGERPLPPPRRVGFGVHRLFLYAEVDDRRISARLVRNGERNPFGLDEKSRCCP